MFEIWYLMAFMCMISTHVETLKMKNKMMKVLSRNDKDAGILKALTKNYDCRRVKSDCTTTAHARQTTTSSQDQTLQLLLDETTTVCKLTSQVKDL